MPESVCQEQACCSFKALSPGTYNQIIAKKQGKISGYFPMAIKFETESYELVYASV